ncbi:MAG: class B sortase [Angelakisella sp.]
MTSKTIKRIKLVAIVILLVIAGISIGIVIESSISERQSMEKRQQLEELYNSSSGQQSVSAESSSSTGTGYAHPQFEELIKINPDLVGWLEVGELSTPVVQREDNEYYLKHDFYGKEDPHGTVFADTRNDLTQIEDNIVLYGHNYNKSKQIFYEVERYKNIEYVTKHPIISFTTLHEKRDYLVFGVFVSNTEPSQGEVFDYHNRLRFKTVKEMEEFIGQVRTRSMISSNIEVTADDQLITLSTCGYEFSGQRIVLMARRLRDDETAETLRTTQYSINPKPLMPEVWMNLYGKKQ